MCRDDIEETLSERLLRHVLSPHGLFFQSSTFSTTHQTLSLSLSLSLHHSHHHTHTHKQQVRENAVRACAGAYQDTARTTAPRFSIVRVTTMMNHLVDMVSVRTEKNVTATRIGPWMRRTERVPRRRRVKNVPTVRVSMENATVRLDGREMIVIPRPSVRTIAVIEDFAIRVSVFVRLDTRVPIAVLTWRESRRNV